METTSSNHIEPLEPRIAPAALIKNVLPYTDLDGDLVKVTFRRATMTPADFTFSTGSVNGGIVRPRALSKINLAARTGAGFTLTATPHAGKGDSHADVGFIDGTNTDLGTIVVDGDVNTITAGTGASGTVGLKSFTALSMGGDVAMGYGTSTLRNAGIFAVKTDVVNEILTFTGGVKSLFIGGNLAETHSAAEAQINVTGDIGSLKVVGSIVARDGTKPNLIATSGRVGTLSIGGDLSGTQIIVGSNKGTDNIPGTADDQAIAGSKAAIGSVKVGGAFTGIAVDATSCFIYGPKVLRVTVAHVTYTEQQVTGGGLAFGAIGHAVAESIS